MKKYSTLKKAIAVLLSVLFFAAFLFSIASIILMASHNFYNRSRTRVRQECYADNLFTHLYSILDYYEESLDGQATNNDPIDYYENTNLAFTVINAQTGQNIASVDRGDYEAIFEDTVYLVNVKGQNVITTAMPKDEPGTVVLLTATGYVIQNDATEDLFGADISLHMLGYDWRYPFIAIAFLSFAALVALLVYLLFAAGHHKGEDGIRSSFLEKIPFDVFTLFYMIAAIVFVIILLTILTYGSFNVLSVCVLMFLSILAYLGTLLYLTSFAVRIKCGGMGRTLLVYRVTAFIFKKLSAFFRFIPLIWKTIIAISLYFLCDIAMILFFGWDADILFLYYILKNLLCGIIILTATVSLRKLQKGGEKIANGDLSYQIDTKTLFGEYKSFAMTLNHISDSMGIAVEERLKSERMKTELITNVSHDIKTPLTSIINYVDLLKKEDIQNGKASEYLSVIDHQSARLKKLICDLVEVSKASTGNIQVHIEECDIAVLLQQAIGEYDEKLKAAGLEAVTHITNLPLLLMVDGNLLWRVFDNLLSNICKYSMPGTRVYLNAAIQDKECVITFKNISKSPLGISCDELMERFVRGDVSRNTEGSGLGLSIAKSLLDLQDGTMQVSSDGDLFKVSVIFPISKPK